MNPSRVATEKARVPNIIVGFGYRDNVSYFPIESLLNWNRF
jgi:hypothetical protein